MLLEQVKICNVLLDGDSLLFLRGLLITFLDEHVLKILVILLRGLELLLLIHLRLGLEFNVVFGHVLEVDWSLSGFSLQGESSSNGS